MYFTIRARRPKSSSPIERATKWLLNCNYPESVIDHSHNNREYFGNKKRSIVLALSMQTC